MNSTIYSLFIALALRVTVVTVFVMLIKAVFRQKLSAAAHCAVWIIPAIQVVFCLGNVRIPMKTSIYNVVGDAAAAAGAAVSGQAAHVDVKNIIVLIYCIGTAALALWYITVFIAHRLKCSRLEPVTDETSYRILRELCAKLRIGERITLRRGEFAQTLGRTILLPDGYTPEEQRQILLHELCHYKHRDDLKLLAAAAVMCLNWFNPLVWAAFGRFRSDVEMYCDDSVMKLTDSRKEYALVLVKTAAKHTGFVPGATGVSSGKHEVARRVKRIASWKKKKPIWLAAAVCACVTVSCLCLTDAVSTAVENTVDITSTPEPAELAPMISGAVSAVVGTEAPEPEPTEETYPEPQRETGGASESAAENVSAATEYEAPARQQTERRTAAEEQPVTEEEYAPEEPAGPAEQPETAEEPEKPTAAESGTEDVYTSLGEPESVSANGNKETYSLDDGRTAVLHYDDGELETGYIINGTQAEPEE